MVIIGIIILDFFVQIISQVLDFTMVLNRIKTLKLRLLISMKSYCLYQIIQMAKIYFWVVFWQYSKQLFLIKVCNRGIFLLRLRCIALFHILQTYIFQKILYQYITWSYSIFTSTEVIVYYLPARNSLFLQAIMVQIKYSSQFFVFSGKNGDMLGFGIQPGPIMILVLTKQLPLRSGIDLNQTMHAQNNLQNQQSINLFNCWINDQLYFFQVLPKNKQSEYKIEYLQQLNSMPQFVSLITLCQIQIQIQFLFQVILINMKSNLPNLQGQIVLKNFKIIQKIGAGAFGQIYKAQNLLFNNQHVAIKSQSIKARFPQLLFEARLLQHIHNDFVKEGIPQVHCVGMENEHNLMVMDLLGKSLDYYFGKNNKIFSLHTVLLIGIQLIDRIQVLHQRGFLHRDIKPDNMVMGINQKSKMLYLIDLGLSKRYINDQNQHIPMKKGNQMIGTLRYASIANHKGWEQSRRDDLQSIIYVLLYFLIGVLPWQNIKADSVKAKIQMIKNKKISTPIQALCKGLPFQFIQFLKYCRNLQFQEKPNYDYLRGLMKEAAKTKNIELDLKYDWDIVSSEECLKQ